MILVTGGSGLVGKELINALLRSGKKVRAIYNKTALSAFDAGMKPEIIQADLLDVQAMEEAMRNVSTVYHCAGFISYLPADKEKLYRINVTGTANVVNAALDAGVKKMLHVSSVAALGRHKQADSVNETMMWTKENSNSIYGHSKFLGEMEVWRGNAEGLQVVIVNPSLIFGNGNWNESSTRIFKSVYDEFPWYSEGVNGMVDLNDLVTVMIQLMESEIQGEKFIVSAHNVCYRDLFNLIADCFHKKPPSKKVTPLLAKMIYTLEAIKSRITGIPPNVTKETAHTALAKVYYDNRKILKALPGFTFTKLDDTVQHVCTALQQKINSQ